MSTFLCVSLSAQKGVSQKPRIKSVVYKSYEKGGNVFELKEQVRTEYDNNGNVAQQITFSLQNGIEDISQKIFYKYDRKQQLRGTTCFDGLNVLKWEKDIEYDKKGRKVKSLITHYKSDGIQESYSTHYEYDGADRKTKVSNFKNDEIQLNEQGFSFQEDGELAHWYSWKLVTDEKNKKTKHTLKGQNKFDRLGNLLRASLEAKEGSFKWKEVKHFKNNFLTLWERFENGELVKSYNNKYVDTLSMPQQYQQENPNKNPIETYPDLLNPEEDESYFDNLENAWVSTNEYNEYGLVKRKVIRAEGRIVRIILFEYDEALKLIKTTRIHKDSPQTEEILKQYDKFQNPTRETHLQNGIKVYQITYTYEYFPG